MIPGFVDIIVAREITPQNWRTKGFGHYPSQAATLSALGCWLLMGESIL
jgi:hypothetical protein